MGWFYPEPKQRSVCKQEGSLVLNLTPHFWESSVISDFLNPQTPWQEDAHANSLVTLVLLDGLVQVVAEAQVGVGVQVAVVFQAMVRARVVMLKAQVVIWEHVATKDWGSDELADRLHLLLPVARSKSKVLH